MAKLFLLALCLTLVASQTQILSLQAASDFAGAEADDFDQLATVCVSGTCTRAWLNGRRPAVNGLPIATSCEDCASGITARCSDCQEALNLYVWQSSMLSLNETSLYLGIAGPTGANIAAYVNAIHGGVDPNMANDEFCVEYLTAAATPFINDIGCTRVSPVVCGTYFASYHNSLYLQAQQIQTNAPSGISGDPHFKGLNGQRFDFHAKPFKYYALVSDGLLAINSYFVDGDLRSKLDKTYMGKIGIRLGQDRVFVSCNRGNESRRMELNGVALTPGRSVDTQLGTVKLSNSANGRITCTTAQYRISVRFSDSKTSSCHLNMRMVYEPVEDSKSVRPHGVLGQTAWKPKVELAVKGINGEGVIDGVWQDYLVDDLFATDFKYSRFDEKESPHSVSGEPVEHMSAFAE